MRFFIDTANLDSIRTCLALGLVDGVTTNPTLISRESGTFTDIASAICAEVDGPVSLEVTALDTAGMVDEARKLARLGPNVVIKVPVTPEGIAAIKALTDQDIPTNATLVFSPLQALLAAKAGADYVSPFVGRLDAIGHDGMDVVAEILEIIDNYAFDTQVLVASIRHPGHVLAAARLGAHVATVPPGVLLDLLKHPLTDSGLEQFLADWKSVAP